MIMTITNEKNRLNNRLNTVFVLLLFVLLIVNTFMRSQFETLIYVGQISVDLTLFIMFLFLMKSWIDRQTYTVSFIPLYTIVFLIGCLYIISYTISPYMTDIIQLLQLLFLLFF